jgi:hypothetical protein
MGANQAIVFSEEDLLANPCMVNMEDEKIKFVIRNGEFFQ